MGSSGAREEEAGTSQLEENLNLVIFCTALVSKAMNGLGMLASGDHLGDRRSARRIFSSDKTEGFLVCHHRRLCRINRVRLRIHMLSGFLFVSFRSAI